MYVYSETGPTADGSKASHLFNVTVIHRVIGHFVEVKFDDLF